MSVSGKWRIHMGCGEALQSRWRVTSPACSQDAQRENPSTRSVDRRAARHKGGSQKR